VSRGKYIFDGPKNQNITFCMCSDGLTMFEGLSVKKIQIKLLLASMKSLTICTNPSSNPLQEGCSNFSNSRL
jgi:hypothetical protein